METLSLRLLVTGSLAMAAASACSLRYDPEDLEPGEDGGDSSIPPGALHVQEVTPGLVFEGQGWSSEPAYEAAVRPIPIVLRGQNFTDEMVVTLEGEALGIDAAPSFTVSRDGRWAALLLRIPVDAERDSGDLPLVIKIVKGDEEAEGSLVRRMLPEFPEDVPGGLPNATEEDPVSLFSRVALTGEVPAVGARPVRVFGFAGISLSGALSADGVGPVPGAGGCAGGAAGADALCGAGSGKAGQEQAGGGGGAFAAGDAMPGGGENERGGAAGEPRAARVLVPMPPDSPGPAGGGGGGDGGLLGGRGNTGGGSGGILELSSPAFILLDGVVSADGAGAGTCAGSGSAGGGGGSGGAVLIRAGAGVMTTTGATLRARGGAGGASTEMSTCAAAGGVGGSGLIRIDRPDEIELDADPAPIRGPALVFLEDEVVVQEGLDWRIAIRGQPGSSYFLRAIGFDRERNTTGVVTRLVATPNGMGEAVLPLWAGHNELCVEADPETEGVTYPESQNCLTVAYIP